MEKCIPTKLQQSSSTKQEISKVLHEQLNISNIKDIKFISPDIKFKNQFKINTVLGVGSYGVVLDVYNKVTLDKSALKVISRRDETLYNEIKNEVLILQELNHPNIIRFKQILYSEEHAFIEMELINAGTLTQFIKQQYQVKHEPIDEETAAHIMRDILEGLSKIHERDFIHRDLKPDNILLNRIDIADSDNNPQPLFQAKIADFGLSAQFKLSISSNGDINQKFGTILYMAPEQALGQRYGKRIDLWASGIIMYMLLKGKHPFYRQSDDEKSYINRIAYQELEPLEPLSKEAASLFWKLCARNLTDRYSVSEALKHPWITRNECDSVPLTKSDQMKLIEADAFLRRVQSTMLFLAIQKLQDPSEIKSAGSLSLNYLEKIEKCNNGIYETVTSDRPMQQSSAATTTDIKEGMLGSPDHPTLDKSFLSRGDEISQNTSKKDQSEEYSNKSFRIMKTNITGKSFRKIRPNALGLQISMQTSHDEPKSANIRPSNFLRPPIAGTISSQLSNNTDNHGGHGSPQPHTSFLDKIQANRKGTVDHDAAQTFSSGNTPDIKENTTVKNGPGSTLFKKKQKRFNFRTQMQGSGSNENTQSNTSLIHKQPTSITEDQIMRKSSQAADKGTEKDYNDIIEEESNHSILLIEKTTDDNIVPPMLDLSKQESERKIVEFDQLLLNKHFIQQHVALTAKQSLKDLHDDFPLQKVANTIKNQRTSLAKKLVEETKYNGAASTFSHRTKNSRRSSMHSSQFDFQEISQFNRSQMEEYKYNTGQDDHQTFCPPITLNSGITNLRASGLGLKANTRVNSLNGKLAPKNFYLDKRQKTRYNYPMSPMAQSKKDIGLGYQNGSMTTKKSVQQQFIGTQYNGSANNTYRKAIAQFGDHQISSVGGGHMSMVGYGVTLHNNNDNGKFPPLISGKKIAIARNM